MRLRRVAALAVVAVLGSLLALPVVAVSTAAPAGAVDIPTCPPGTPSTDRSCMPDDQLPGGVERPPIGELGPVLPVNGSTVRQEITVTGPEIGGLCPSGGVPFARMPCTMRGVNAGGGTYVPAGVDPSSYGRVNVASDPNGPSCMYSVDHTCTLWISYNPSSFTGSVTVIISVSTTVVGDLNGDGNFLDGLSYSFTVSVNGTGNQAPTADFTVSQGGTPGDRTFSATSTAADGGPLSHAWDFGDGGSGTGTLGVHTYTRPGEFDVRLTSTDQSGRAASVTKKVTVAAATLGLSIDLLDGAAPPLSTEVPVRARVTVSAGTDGLGAISNVRFDGGVALTVSPAGAFDLTAGPTPPVPTGGFTLQPGEQRSFEVTLAPAITGRYDLVSRVTGTDATGQQRSATASSPGEIGEALKIAVVLDPPQATQDEGPDGPEPIDVTATLTFTNTTPVAMTDVVLTSLRVDRTQSGQLLAVTQTGGIDPGDDGVSIGSLAPGQSKTATATFRATDDAEVEFSAMATAAMADGRTEIGVGRQRWSVEPRYLVSVTTRVTNPPSGQLLPAGELVRISGTVHNLSTSATLELGPLYPTLTGNAGAMSLTWDDTGSDPKALIPAGNLTLEPGESRHFSVRFLTGWSDPRGIAGDNPHGGTYATATFTPWGIAHLEDGTVVDITPAKVKATEADLTHRVSIDDSIAIPTTDHLALGGAIMVGTLEGVWSATAATVSSVSDLIKLPYTVIVATAEFQSQVWNSFTESEKEDFANDTGLMVAAILARNAEYGKQGAQALWQAAKDSTLEKMTEMANEWAVGDYTRTAELYTRYATDAVAQAVIPVALGKLAKSPRAVAALVRAQEALQARMGPVLAESALVTKIEQLGPILNALESGTELRPEQLATLYGITAEELTELQRLADELDVLMTVRSRHASSIEWIERFQAMLKPETLKIKTVSELDSKLGYRASDIGSLVFRKPEPLRAFDAGQGDLGALINEFVTSKGFVPGTGEWENAVNRVVARSAEWRKWEKYYKRWDSQGWIDVSFNYEGNAITDPLKKPKSSLGVAPLESGKYVGFEMKAIGEEEYVLQMMNPKAGRMVPITGDIDPIAFTHLDGSPLTMEEHAVLLDKLAKNALLQAQHGESATFVKGGVDFVLGQFKPNEPGLQIAPGGHLPRVVRLNTGESRWANSFDYHLHWDGGFVYSGSYVPKGAIPKPPVVVPAVTEPLPMRPRAIPQATTAEPNVGRCRVTFGTAPDAVQAIVDVHGKLSNLAGDGRTTTQSPLHDECFSPGPPVEVEVKPVTGLTERAEVGATEIEIPEGDPWLASAGDGLSVGDVVTIGAGTDHAESHTIIAFGSIIVGDELQHAHEPGELIIVTEGAPLVEPPAPEPPTPAPPSTEPPMPEPATGEPATTTAGAPPPAVLGATSRSISGSASSAGGTRVGSPVVGSDLALTGQDGGDELRSGLALLCIGLLFVGLSRRRRPTTDATR